MKDLNRFISDIENLFSVTFGDAKKMIKDLHLEMGRGLAGKKSSLKMIPSFVNKAQGFETGRCLALDLGGTNLRVLAVDLDGRGNTKVFAVSKFTISAEIMKGTGDALFDLIAECIREFLIKNGLSLDKKYDLAFTFSFPVEQTSLSAGKLIVWTKGFKATGVEGKDVVALLNAALIRRGLKFIDVVALANDTVGTLVAKSYNDRFCDMGVILGTGTNACYVEKISNITKMKFQGANKEMIINMEWGNFSKLKLNRYDKALDKASQNPGRQYLEKMVSGMYLGEITRRIVADMISRGIVAKKELGAVSLKPYSFRTEDMSQIAKNGAPLMKKICGFVSLRSAKIAGLAVAAVITWMDGSLKKKHTVGIDGSLFEKYPGFEKNIKKVFLELFGKRAANIKLKMAKDGSGIGAAVIAASSRRSKKN